MSYLLEVPVSINALLYAGVVAFGGVIVALAMHIRRMNLRHEKNILSQSETHEAHIEMLTERHERKIKEMSDKYESNMKEQQNKMFSTVEDNIKTITMITNSINNNTASNDRLTNTVNEIHKLIISTRKS